MIEEIHNLYGPDVIALIEKKDDMHRNVDTLKSTVQLTELIIKGKDMELLLLQKEIQEKLQAFSRTSVAKELPKTVHKVIHFVPGMLDMGYIHDSDRPLLSQTRHRFNNQSEDYFDPSDCFNTVGTQTSCTSGHSVEISTNTSVVVRCDGSTQTDVESNGIEYELCRQQTEPERDNDVGDQTSARRRRRRREREKAVEEETTLTERQSRRDKRQSRSYDID